MLSDAYSINYLAATGGDTIFFAQQHRSWKRTPNSLVLKFWSRAGDVCSLSTHITMTAEIVHSQFVQIIFVRFWHIENVVLGVRRMNIRVGQGNMLQSASLIWPWVVCRGVYGCFKSWIWASIRTCAAMRSEVWFKAGDRWPGYVHACRLTASAFLDPVTRSRCPSRYINLAENEQDYFVDACFCIHS